MSKNIKEKEGRDGKRSSADKKTMLSMRLELMAFALT
jgi:hypothetical protein